MNAGTESGFVARLQQRMSHDAEMATAVLRFIAGTAMVVAQRVGLVDDPFGVFSWAIALAMVYAFGVLAAMAVQFSFDQRYPPLFTRATTLLDNATIVVLVVFTGGVNSPIVAVLLLVITTNAARYGVAPAVWWAIVDSVLLLGISVFVDEFGTRSDRLYLAGWWSWLLIGGAVIAGMAARAAAEYRAELAAESNRVSTARYERLLADRAREELETAAAARRDFLRVVTHELRTPIASIGALSRALADTDSSIPASERAEMLGLVHGHAAHLQELLDGVRDLAVTRQRVGGPPRLVTLALREVLRGAASAAGLESDRLGIEVSAMIHPMRSDGEKVRRVFTNLFENAARHSRGVVEAVAELDGGAVVVDVRDRGRGLSEEEAARVFEKGFSLGGERESSGLGLWIVNELIVELGGEVRALPRAGGGLIMRVRLPYEASEPAATSPAADEVPGRPPA